MIDTISLVMFSFFGIISLSYILYLYPMYFRGIKQYSIEHSENKLVKLLSKIKFKPIFIIQITTRGDECDTIHNGLSKIDSYYNSLSTEIKEILQFEILTEVNSDREFFQKKKISFPIKTIIVPKNYYTKNNAKLKARALQYMINKRNKEMKKLENCYIIHFDAESTITSKNLITLIYMTLIQPNKLILQGPITYPVNYFKSSIFSRQMEALRPWNCYECLANTRSSYPYHLHGSNLVIRADIEYKIGWDYKDIDGYPIVAEDLFFGIKATFILGKDVFGWHGAELYEQPALTLLASLSQRIRWIRGSLQALYSVPDWDSYQKISSKDKRVFQSRVKGKMYLYAMGFLPATITVGILLYTILFSILSGLNSNDLLQIVSTYQVNIDKYQANMVPDWLMNLTMLGAILWLLTIQIGLYHNIKSIEMNRSKRILEHLKIFLITPIVTIFDTGIVFYTLIRWSLGNRKATWIITPKSVIF